MYQNMLSADGNIYDKACGRHRQGDKIRVECKTSSDN